MALNRCEATETDGLIDQLLEVNQRLLSLDVEELAGIAQAVEQRGELVTRIGRLLRDLRCLHQSSGSVEALDQALKTGDTAVQRLLSFTLPETWPANTCPGPQ